MLISYLLANSKSGVSNDKTRQIKASSLVGGNKRKTLRDSNNPDRKSRNRLVNRDLRGMSNSGELQARSRVTIRLSVALPAKAKKTKVRTKESAHKHDLFPPPLEVRGSCYLVETGTHVRT
jgi:hypothetical protein